MRILTVKNNFLIFVITLLSSVVFANTNNTRPMSDSELNAKVKQEISSNKDISGLDVKVNTKNSVVHISGNVDSDTLASELVETAQSIRGVSDVDTNNLNIKSSEHPLTDTYITAKVKGMFIQEKLFGDKNVAPMSISVETTDGVVYLSGTADSQDQVNNAKKIARNVKGVKKVESTIKLSSDQPASYNNGASNNTSIETNQ